MPSEGFTQVVNVFLRNPRLSAPAKLVGALMASHADPSRIAWPGTELLMREGSLRRDAVEKGRSDLVKAGYLKKSFKRDAHGKFSGIRYKVSEEILPRRLPKNP